MRAYEEGGEGFEAYDPCQPGLDLATLECDRNVIIAPETEIPYSVLVRAMDAVREEVRRGNPKQPDGATDRVRTLLTDAELDPAKVLGSFNEAQQTDVRVDRAGNWVAHKRCATDAETGQRSSVLQEVSNELFPYVVIAGGTALVRQ